MTLTQVLERVKPEEHFRRDSYPTNEDLIDAYDVYVDQAGLFHQIQVGSMSVGRPAKLDNIVSLRKEDILADDWKIVRVIDLPIEFVTNPILSTPTTTSSTTTT